MRIAFFMDFSISINRREGITAYCGYLMNGLLEQFPSLELEVWVHQFNKKCFRSEYSDIIEKYGDRVFVYSGDDFPSTTKKEYIHITKYYIYKAIHKICSILKLERIKRAASYRADYQYIAHFQRETDISNIANSNSKAQVVFVPYPGLQAALKINKPCVVQVHDLFTFPLIKLFNEESMSKHGFTKGNKVVKRIMERYAKKGAIFVSSSEYTRDTQILRYIKGVTKSQCEVISFPPMYTHFDSKNVLSEEEFREKYSIEGKYVAFPSQNRPNKNVIQLLKALKILNDKGIEVKLVTTGSMLSCNSTAKFVKQNKNYVIELGNLTLDELYCLYKYSEMVICPNIIEGLGISGQCLEGLAVGKPVVHVKSMGMEDSLKSVGLNYETAKLNWVEIGDCEKMALMTEYVLNNKEQVIEDQKSVLEAYSKMSWRDVAVRYIEVFNKVVK